MSLNLRRNFTRKLSSHEVDSNFEYLESLIKSGSYSISGPQGPPGISITGPQGPKGSQGSVGHQGLTGPKGDQGLTGPKGDQGLTGPKGDQGLTGPKGDQGLTGNPGPQGFQGPIGIVGNANTIVGLTSAIISYLTTLPGYGDDKVLSSQFIWISIGNGSTQSLTQSTINTNLQIYPISNKNTNSPDFTVVATSNSPAPILFTSSNNSVITIDGDLAHIVNKGSTIISAIQNSVGLYTPKTATQSLVVTDDIIINRISGEIPYVPNEDAYMLQSGTNNMTWLKDNSYSNYSPNWSELVDMQDTYIDISRYNSRVSHIVIYDGAGSYGTPTEIFIGSDGQEEKIGETTGQLYEQTQQFPSSPFSIPKSANYIRLHGYKREFPAELKIYGDYIQQPTKNITRSKTPFKLRTGANTFVWNYYTQGDYSSINENKYNVIKSFGCVRDYLDWERIEDTEGSYSYYPTKSGGFNLDFMYKRLHDDGIDVLVCIKTVPSWIRSTWPGSEQDTENVPVKWKNNIEETVESFSDPQSYISGAKLAYQFAARYGNNQNIDPSTISVYTSSDWQNNTKKIGLGYVKYFEVENERDKWWKGRKAYQTAYEYAAMMSAYYDGHMGHIGPNTGIKQADPTMKVVIGGMALPEPAYIHGMLDWCKLHRGYLSNGDVNICWDIINYHEYSNDGGMSQAGNPTRGKAPELTYLTNTANKFLKFSNDFLNGMEVWNTEVGFDIDQYSIQRSPAIGNKTAKDVQADWLLRTSLLYSKLGIERMFIYMLPDAGGSGRFGSSGLWDEPNTWTAIPRPSANFLKQANNIIGEYTYEETLSDDPRVDKYIYNTNTVYVCWIPDEVDRSSTYNLLLPSNPTITVYRLDGYKENASSETIQVSNGVYIASCTETPIFIKI